MNSATKYNAIVNHSMVDDPKSKCGEILISFKSFTLEFACTLCPGENKYTTFMDFLNHVTQEHSFTSDDEGEDISMSEFYDDADVISDDPLGEQTFGGYEEIEVKDEEDDKYEITTEILSDSENLGDCLIGDNDDKTEITQDEKSNVLDDSKHCNLRECEEKNPKRRKRILKVIDMFRKCVGLWHKKTASNASVKEKKLACRLLAKHYGIRIAMYKMNLMLNRLTTCFNASWKTDKTQKPRPWYYNELQFLKFADDDVVPNDFADFRCPFCTRVEVNASDTMDLWNHIIRYRHTFDKLLDSKELYLSSDDDDDTEMENNEDGLFSEQGNAKHCTFRECREQDPTRRFHFANLIGIYQKCIGLWHMKTERNTSRLEKIAVHRLLAQHYGMPIPVYCISPILQRMTSCFNRAWKFNKAGKPKPWYYKKLAFLKFAYADEVPNDMFDDFRCPFCTSDEVHASDAMDLWNHIVDNHKSLNSLDSTTNGNPLRWPTKHILEFINIYRKQECVWNSNSADYFNRSLKAKGYQTIIEQFSKVRPGGLKNRNSVVNVIIQLRSHFRRVQRKLQVSNVLEEAQTTEEIEHRKVYEELLFLKDMSKKPEKSFPSEINYCDFCEKNFQNKSLFHRHFKLRHKDAEFKCNICPVAFTTEVNLKNHQDTHEQGDGELYECPCCHLVYMNSRDLEGHLFEHLPDRLGEQICPVCEQKLNDRGSLSIHLRRHTNIKRYFCDSCPKGFVTSTDLKLHAKTHSDNRPYVCEVCGMCYKHRHQLTAHHRLHEEPRFKCKDCDMKFILRTNLREHEKTHEYSGVPIDKVVCEVCHRLFGHAKALRRHQRLVHKISRTNCIRKKNIKTNTK